jgi:hypothetical protein
MQLLLTAVWSNFVGLLDPSLTSPTPITRCDTRSVTDRTRVLEVYDGVIYQYTGDYGLIAYDLRSGKEINATWHGAASTIRDANLMGGEAPQRVFYLGDGKIGGAIIVGTDTRLGIYDAVLGTLVDGGVLTTTGSTLSLIWTGGKLYRLDDSTQTIQEYVLDGTKTIQSSTTVVTLVDEVFTYREARLAGDKLMVFGQDNLFVQKIWLYNTTNWTRIQHDINPTVAGNIWSTNLDTSMAYAVADGRVWIPATTHLGDPGVIGLSTTVSDDNVGIVLTRPTFQNLSNPTNTAPYWVSPLSGGALLVCWFAQFWRHNIDGSNPVYVGGADFYPNEERVSAAYLIDVPVYTVSGITIPSNLPVSAHDTDVEFTKINSTLSDGNGNYSIRVLKSDPVNLVCINTPGSGAQIARNIPVVLEG